MTEHLDNDPIERLSPYIGEWRMQAAFPDTVPVATAETQGVARTVFEWLAGRRFVVQRWEVPHPTAPDGIAVIGWEEGKERYVQHYFDSRGVARLYEMSFAGGVWKLWRTAADFSPLDFSQRYSGTFGDDGRTIRGSWESSRDGSHWEHDFELLYTKAP
jgi:hypothetical protein